MFLGSNLRGTYFFPWHAHICCSGCSGEVFLDRISASIADRMTWRQQPLTWSSVARSGSWILCPDQLDAWTNPNHIGESYNSVDAAPGTGYTAASDAHDPLGAFVLNRAATTVTEQTQPELDVRHLVQLADRVWADAAKAWEQVMQKRSFREIREAQLAKRRRMAPSEQQAQDAAAERLEQEDVAELRNLQSIQDCRSNAYGVF